MTTLTPAGRRYALAQAPTSIVARVALAADVGGARDWAPAFRETAITTMNRQGGAA